MRRARNPSTLVFPVVLLLGAATASVAVLAGLPVVPLWFVATLSLASIFRGRYGPFLSIALGVAAFLLTELFLLRVSAALPIPLPVMEVVVWLAVCVAIAVRAMTVRVRRAPGGRNALPPILASLSGALLLCGVVVFAQLREGSNALSWAMRGDSVNIVVIARAMVGANGIDSAATHQPTPLPFGIVASNFAPGRGAIADGDLLRHDVERYGQVWIAIIALASLLAALAVARVLVERTPRFAIVAATFTSMVPLTWYFMGIQFEWGFINTSFALVALLTSWLMQCDAGRHPLPVLAGQFAIATVLLAIWSPLVIIVAAFGVVALVRGARHFGLLSIRRRVLLAIPSVIFLGYALLVTVPDFFQNAEFLSRPGAFPALEVGSVLVISGVVAVLGCLALTDSASSTLAAGALAAIAALSVGVAFLIYQRRTEPILWSYYPQKFSYTISLLFIVIALTLITAIVTTRSARRGTLAATFVASVLLTSGLVVLTSNDDPRPHSYFPLPTMAKGTMFRTSEGLADTVLEWSGRADGLDLAWNFPDRFSDNLLNFWWLQADLPDTADQEARLFAQDQEPRSAADVCAVVRAFDETLVIHTADPRAEDQLRDTCGDLDYRVLVDTDQRSLYNGL